MPLAELDGMLLAGAVWGLALAALVPAFPLPGVSSAARLAASRGVAALSSLLLAAVGALALAQIFPDPVRWWPGLPGDPFVIAADALNAPFLLLLGLVAAASFIGATPRTAPVGAAIGERTGASLHAVFVLALATVFGAQHALLFLLAWEGMTLVSAALVASDVRSARARTAAYLYLSISHVGTAFLGYALLRLSAAAGSYAFSDLAAALSAMPAGESHLICWLVTAGCAVKLGIAPLHVWLPLAHPEAPAPVSAVLSGAMVKAGLYGMLRFAWQMPGMPPPGWGETLMIFGAITALIGALSAVVESDAKRLLAFSTIKHSGLLALALGTSASLAADGRWPLAGLALTACLYHAVGHGLAKGAAFLSVGAAAHAAGSRDLEHLGGLARRLPRLSLAALIASLALCGAPLLSCFTGEWLLFQSMILGFSAGSGHLRILVPFAGAGLALATALAGAALVKLYGIAFLGRARSAAAADVRREAPSAEVAMLALAGACVVWGVGAPWWVPSLAAPLQAVLGPAFDPASLAAAGGLVLTSGSAAPASFSPLAVLMLVLVFVGIAFAWGTARGLRSGVRRAPSWSCGISLTPRMQYSALGFTKPLRLIFSPVLRNEDELEVLAEGSPYFGKKRLQRNLAESWIQRTFYQPLLDGVLWASERARMLQAGNLHLYLAYLLFTVVALLLFAR